VTGEALSGNLSAENGQGVLSYPIDPVSPPTTSRAPALPYRCSSCPARWNGLRTAHCSGCHRTFTAPGPFDKHWRGSGDDRHCVDPATVGLVEHDRLGYVAWGAERDEQAAPWWRS
jgi:hypothetical protein